MFGLAIADDGRVAVETANGAAPASHALFVFGPSATTTDHFVFSGGWEYGSAVQPVFLPDGRMVYAERDEGGASGAPTQPTRLYVYAGGTDATVLPGEVPGGVIDLAVSATGRLLATGTDHVVRTFDGTTWHEVARGYSAAAW
jgi:hypothetical protein